MLTMGGSTAWFPIEPYMDQVGLLQPSTKLIPTMAGAQKCMQMISPDDLSLYIQPHEGPTWAFVARCIGASIPLHIEKALYFFYRLMSHIEINGLTEYVVPTPNLSLQYDRRGGKRVVGVTRQASLFRRPDQDQEQGINAPSDSSFCFRRAMDDACAGGGKDVVDTMCVPLTLRIGFTGALYESTNEEGVSATRQELFCVLFVTPLRNVDLLSYIHQCFLARSKTAGPDSKQRESDVNELEFIWRTLLQYEAYQNLGLRGNEGDPFSYSLDSGGVLGADTLLSMLYIPVKVYEVVKKRSGANPLRRLTIMGFPSFDFVGGGEDARSYVAYVMACTRAQASDRRNLVSWVERFNNVKPGDRNLFDAPVLRCPGGWPLCVTESGFREFGIPPLPVLLSWSISKNHTQLVTFDSFKLNSGSLPMLALFMMRKFLAFEVDELYRDVGGSAGELDPVDCADQAVSDTRARIIQDEAVITDTLVATPLEISIRYYGDQANPLQNLVTAGCLRAWWSSMRDFVYMQREKGSLSVLGAAQCFERYIASGMESHRGMILSKSYWSLRIEHVSCSAIHVA